MNIWWCNQSEQWESESAAGIVCAALGDNSTFRKTVGEVKAGDIIVHYRKNDGLVAFSRAKENGKFCDSLPAPYKRGWRCHVEYYVLPKAVEIEKAREALSKHTSNGYPIRVGGKGKEGYFFTFDFRGLRALLKLCPQPIPAEWLNVGRKGKDMNIWLYHINPKLKTWSYDWDVKKPETFDLNANKRWPAGNKFRKVAVDDIICVYMKNIPARPDGVYVVGTIVKVGLPKQKFEWRAEPRLAAQAVGKEIPSKTVKQFFKRSYGGALQSLPPGEKMRAKWMRILRKRGFLESAEWAADDVENDNDNIWLDENLSTTEKKQEIKARQGQGLFRQRVYEYWKRCPVTRCGVEGLLRASHIKPWSESTHKERLDGFNGLLLAPTIDLAFDRGFISFTANGQLLVSARLPVVEAKRLGIHSGTQIKFTKEHQQYLEFHRKKHGFRL